uniref:DUF3668 domain-containing protein n=1 Tax=Schistocephalus solidus TaxID=70667 RepID=A0A183SHY4_SCHSO
LPPRILKLRWQDRIPDTEVLERTGILSVHAMLRQLQLRWSGHLVSFDGFPQQLFEGEIHSLRLNLTNSGLEPLINVRFISSWPGFFVFATKDICLTSRLESNPIDFIQRLPLLDGDLAPSACVEQPLWLRAPLLSARKRTFASSTLLPPPWPTSAASQTSSSTALAAPHPPVSAHVKQVHLVFSYSAANPSIAASSGPRYLRHEALLKLLPSLRIQATTCQTYGSSVGNLLLTLQCKNVSKERPKIDGINSTKANSTGEVDFSEFRLIAFWKVITSNTDSLSDRLGLSRICISLQNRKPFEAASGTRHLPPPTSTSLIRLRLLHPSRISHCFSKRSQSLAPPALNEVSSMALVPVVAEVYNASSVPVLVRLEAADIDSRGSRLPLGPLHSLDSSAPPPKPGIEPYRGSVSLPSVLWIGISLRHFRLEAAESRKLHLEARVCEVGVYDVMGGLRVSAAPVRPDDASPNFVNQTCNYSSLLVVEATTTSCGRGS